MDSRKGVNQGTGESVTTSTLSPHTKQAQHRLRHRRQWQNSTKTSPSRSPYKFAHDLIGTSCQRLFQRIAQQRRDRTAILLGNAEELPGGQPDVAHLRPPAAPKRALQGRARHLFNTRRRQYQPDRPEPTGRTPAAALAVLSADWPALLMDSGIPDVGANVEIIRTPFWP